MSEEEDRKPPQDGPDTPSRPDPEPRAADQKPAPASATGFGTASQSAAPDARAGSAPAATGPGGKAGVPIPGTAYSGNSPQGYVPPPKRSSAQIRADIEAQRAELGQSVDQLRGKVTELTDWRGQLRKHRKEVTIAAVATGFVIGGLLAMRRRR